MSLITPGRLFFDRCLLDTGAGDTIFPVAAAIQLGIDLSAAPSVVVTRVGAPNTVVRYTRVEIRETDGLEYAQWEAVVGFSGTPLPYPLLGFAGFLQFFTAAFYGDLEKVTLERNSLYPGT